MNKKRLLLSLLCAFFLFWGTAPSFAQEAVIIEEKQVFKTYPYSDPNPAADIGRIYPYFEYSGYSHTGKDREWRVVRLENPYIKVLVTPQIGGKVWGAIEKSTGKAFIYWNKVVKFRDIAMRGPWTSGGIEFNFGAIGHAPTCATPVDYILKKNSDGSVSCIIGAIDLPSRTRWRVNIRLPKDSAYFETQSFWYNPTPLNHSYYHWMNAAADSGKDLHFYYPGTNYIDHGGNAFSWPVDRQGRDISIYGNNNFGHNKSYHVLGNYSEYFGGYWRDSDFGFGNWSLYNDKPGKKIWIWALSRQGEIWKDLLTDKGNKQYVEIQSGLLLNQAGSDSSRTPFKHAFFAPYASTRAAEIWFPIKEIGGLSAASPYGALSVRQKGDTLEIGLCPLQPTADELSLMIAGEKIYTKYLELKPMEVFIDSVKIPGGKAKIVINLGTDKLYYSSGAEEETRLQRPLTAPEGYDWDSAEGLFTAGEELAKQRRYSDALSKFYACLEKEPFHTRALVGAAEIYFRRGEFREALAFASKVLTVNAYDPAGNFAYGISSRELGNLFDAKDGFGWAARSMEFRSAAYTQLAEVYLLEKKLKRAEGYAYRALDYNRFNMAAYRVLAIVYRKQGRKEEAVKILAKILDLDPLNHFARFEQLLLESITEKMEEPPAANFLKKVGQKLIFSEQSIKYFNSSIRSELPHETYLELAVTYANLGLKKEAIKVLETGLSLSYPTIYYWLAYLDRENPGGKSDQYLEKALQSSPYLVFPFRRETIPVLLWAAAEKNHWKSKYYPGLILWNKGRLAEAVKLFEQCGDAPDFAPFYTARGRLLKALNRSPETIIKDFKKAVRLDAEEWRSWHILCNYYEELGRCKEALSCAQKIYRENTHNYILAMDYARALLHNGEYNKCLTVLAGTTVLPYEGSREGRDIYRQANLLAALELFEKSKYAEAVKHVAKARLWPENLGVGKPYTTDERPEDYIEALCFAKQGKMAKVEQLYRKINDYTLKNWTQWGAMHYIGALVLRESGQANKANQLLQEWHKAKGAGDIVARWAAAMFNRDTASAAQILKQTKALGTADIPWNPARADREFPLLLKLTELIE